VLTAAPGMQAKGIRYVSWAEEIGVEYCND
jgi:hypothetical protein